ncbi:MAG TPA: tetratricopeptide repeat protein [Ignavibacteriaceae bacterium]|nr:tetratricopeptide repeat protein [Ignavibacteriaceae bacterium]
MKKKLQILSLSILAFLFLTANINAQEAKFDSLVTSGIRQIYGIKFLEAETTFKKVVSEYPDKPAGRFFLAMIDWWKILLDPDNESYDDGFYDKLDNVIDQCDELLDKNSENVDALFFKGGAIGFRGRLHAFRESWLKAADDGREALPLVTRAGKLDPKKIDVQLGYGIYNYYAAVLPEKYSMLKPLMLFFPSSDKEKGIKQLNYVSRDGQYAKYEAQYFLMGIYYQFENKPTMAQKFAEKLNQEFPDNPVFERWLGRIFAKESNWSVAAGVFKNVIKKSQKGLFGYTLKPVLREAEYYIAYDYRTAGNLDSAKVHFLKCAELSKEIDGNKESGFWINSYLFLGMINDIEGNRTKAVEYYKKLLDMNEYGNSKDKAEQYLKNPYK